MGKKVGGGMKARGEKPVVHFNADENGGPDYDLSAVAGQNEVPKTADLEPKNLISDPKIPASEGVPLEGEFSQVLEISETPKIPTDEGENRAELTQEAPKIAPETPELPPELEALREQMAGGEFVAFTGISGEESQARLERLMAGGSPSPEEVGSAIRAATPEEVAELTKVQSGGYDLKFEGDKLKIFAAPPREVLTGERPDGTYGLVVTIPEGMIEPIREQAASDGISPEEWVTMRLVEVLETWWYPAKGR